MKIKMTMDATQKCSLFSLAVVALLPFALVCCHASSSSDVLVDNGSRLVPSPDENPSPTIAKVDAAMTDTTITDAAAAAKPDLQLSFLARTPHDKCVQLRNDMDDTIASSLACTKDADCTQVYTSCGLSGVCGVSIAKNAEATVKARSKMWEAASCLSVMTPPCPTCAMPPPPKCVSGKCK